jgi:hypothetical protein
VTRRGHGRHRAGLQGVAGRQGPAQLFELKPVSEQVDLSVLLAAPENDGGTVDGIRIVKRSPHPGFRCAASLLFGVDSVPHRDRRKGLSPGWEGI